MHSLRGGCGSRLGGGVTSIVHSFCGSFSSLTSTRSRLAGAALERPALDPSLVRHNFNEEADVIATVRISSTSSRPLATSM